MPLAQRWHLDVDRVDPVVEILAELAGPHERLQIAIRRADELKFDLPALLAAYAHHLAVLDHTQQLHLHTERHVRDFVEEQSASAGLFEDASSGLHRSGEGASFVAEELGLEQGFREGAAVDGDERPFLPWKCKGVQPLCDLFLAGAGLAGDEGVRCVGCYLVERCLQVAHGARYASTGACARFLEGLASGRQCVLILPSRSSMSNGFVT